MPQHEGLKTINAIAASQQVTTAGVPGLLYGYKIKGGTTSQTVVTFRDGGSGGTPLWKDSLIAQAAAGDVTVGVSFTYPIIFTKDIYVTFSGGAGAAVAVSYIPFA